MQSTFVDHAPCPNCGSSNNVGVYSDGHGFCFGCQIYLPKKGEPREVVENEPAQPRIPVTPLTDVFRAIPKRGLTEEAIRKYEIDVCMDKSVDVAHRYPYFKDGQHVSNKVRKRTEKAFWSEGDPKDAELFGQHLFPGGSAKAVTVVEGELDAPSAWLLLGSRYPVVSVGNSGSALKDCKRNFEYLNSFDEIVLCFDNDTAKVRPDGTKFYPGQDAAKKVAELFAPGKCRILTLQHGKDPNEYRQKDINPQVFTKEWWNAPRHRPDGLVNAADLLEAIIDPPNYFTVEYPWEGVNQKTYGMRLSEFYLWMADTGIGKTSILKETAYKIAMDSRVKEAGYGVGMLMIEEPNRDTALGLLSVHNSKPYHLPDVQRTREEMIKAHKEVLADGRIILYDSFGSNDVDIVVNKIRHMAAMGCKYIFLDHLSIIVSDQAGDERKQLDEISTKLKTLTIELNICVHAVIHTNRNGQARGSAGPEKVANIHFSMERDKKDPDEWRRNVMKISIEKNRFCGRTGPATWLFYDEATGRMVELSDELIEKYENGLTANDTDDPWA